MRVGTWNIGSGFTFKDGKIDKESLNYFVRELKKISPDILCLQEADTKSNQAGKIAKALGMGYRKCVPIHPNHITEIGTLSIAVLSKFPIISSKYYKLPNPKIDAVQKDGSRWKSFDKGFLYCTVNYNGNNIYIVSGHTLPVHKFHRDYMNKKFSKVRKKIEKIINRNCLPKIIGADMNYDNPKQLIPNVFKKGLKDVITNTSTTPEGKQSDHIIVSSHWKVINHRVIEGRADHYLCIVDLELIP